MLITKRIDFSASHRCWNPRLTPEENRAIYGANANQHGHGHNYVVDVTLEGEPDPVTGMIFDLKKLKDLLQEHIVEPMDHRHLNHEVAPFDRVVPTAENLAVEIWRRLQAPLGREGVRLQGVRLFETPDLWVEVLGEPAPVEER